MVFDVEELIFTAARKGLDGGTIVEATADFQR